MPRLVVRGMSSRGVLPGAQPRTQREHPEERTTVYFHQEALLCKYPRFMLYPCMRSTDVWVTGYVDGARTILKFIAIGRERIIVGWTQFDHGKFSGTIKS